MKGHIRERSPGHWAIVISQGSGKGRKLKWHSFKGNKREAHGLIRQCRLQAGVRLRRTYRRDPRAHRSLRGGGSRTSRRGRRSFQALVFSSLAPTAPRARRAGHPRRHARSWQR